MDVLHKISYSLRRKCPRWSPDDIWASVLEHGWKRLLKYKPARCSPEKYLSFSVYKDVIYDYMHERGYRKQTHKNGEWILRHNQLNIGDSIYDIEDNPIQSIEQLKTEFSTTEEDIMRMRLNGLSVDKIAERINKSRSWVFNTLNKIKLKLENTNGYSND